MKVKAVAILWNVHYSTKKKNIIKHYKKIVLRLFDTFHIKMIFISITRSCFIPHMEARDVTCPSCALFTNFCPWQYNTIVRTLNNLLHLIWSYRSHFRLLSSLSCKFLDSCFFSGVLTSDVAPFPSFEVSVFAFVIVARLRLRITGLKSSLSFMIQASSPPVFSNTLKESSPLGSFIGLCDRKNKFFA